MEADAVWLQILARNIHEIQQLGKNGVIERMLRELDVQNILHI